LSLGEVETRQKSARQIDTPHTAQPRIAILGKYPFTSIVTNSGGGETRYGDIVINRGPVSVYFPLATSIVISIVLTVVLNLFWRR